MPKKLNFLGGMQNYNEHTGEYEPALTGANGQVVKDADGDGKINEAQKKTSKEVNVPYQKGVKGKIVGENEDTYEIEYTGKNGVVRKEQFYKNEVEQDFNDPSEAAHNKAEEKDISYQYEKKTDRESNEDIDWDRARKNEKFNGEKAKSQTRKDKYGNPLVSDEAFNVGYEAGKQYLEDSLKYDSLDSLKKSNVFLGYMRDYVSNSIINNGFDPNLDVTYQDENEIIGSILGEEVDLEAYEENATKGWTGKKYTGYFPGKESPKTEEPKQEIRYPKGTSKEYTDKVNESYNKALPVLEKAGIKLEEFKGETNSQGGFDTNAKEIMDKYVFTPFREKYPSGNNEAWEREYKPLWEAIDTVLDKQYNDWYIKNAPLGY